MTVTIAELAAALSAEAAGNVELAVARPAPPDSAGPDDIVVAMLPKYARKLADCRARAAILWPGADYAALGFEAAIFPERPRLAMAGLTAAFDAGPDIPLGIHPLSDVAADAVLGAAVAIGPFVSIGPGARIGDGARLLGHVSIGAGAEIGDEALIHPGVRIGARVRIGRRAIIHANAVIGADGFSFVTAERGAVEQARESGRLDTETRTDRYLRIASLGSVAIGDDVEIGAGSCIDRGTIADTVIGSGTKIDNLVQIGHNVVIGSTCLICGHVGIAGSAEIGERVVLGGKVGVSDHIRIGSDVVVAGGSLVGANVPSGSVMMGVPALRKDKAAELLLLGRRLPSLFADVETLKKRVSNSSGSG
ncbi:MAG: UDP-3-O-(3-hydroxymyristoyl)glucosamine N-acyltransferase [Alphaproteobacteria bacterium]|nr:MAG: UDP-3-O-(3-hydroxymyristoyl)glucosamine N-acyltransferase [Alphaproteobacteria bacterium]